MKNSINTLLLSALFLANMPNGLGQLYSQNSSNGIYHNTHSTEIGTIDTNENDVSLLYQYKHEFQNDNEPKGDVIKHRDSTTVSDSNNTIATTENTWGAISSENLNGENQLHWTLEKEDNIDYFVIEQSTNGKDFSEVGNLKGNEKDIISNQFTFVHKDAIVPLSYYRVKQVDLQGKATYSKVMRMSANNNAAATISSMMVYPNPVNSNADISVNFSQGSSYMLNITDAEGKMIVTQAGNASKGVNNIPFDMNGQKSGIYYISLTGANGLSHVSKFVKD